MGAVNRREEEQVVLISLSEGRHCLVEHVVEVLKVLLFGMQTVEQFEGLSSLYRLLPVGLIIGLSVVFLLLFFA